MHRENLYSGELFCNLFIEERMLIMPLASFVPVPPAVEHVQNETDMDGTDLTKECNVTTETPPLTVFWENAKSGQIIDGKLLIITKCLENDVH